MELFKPLITSTEDVYSKTFPLFKNLRATTPFKAFILAGIFQSILLSFIFVSKDEIDKFKKPGILNWVISIFYIFIITVISYVIMYLLFGFGSGMLISN